MRLGSALQWGDRLAGDRAAPPAPPIGPPGPRRAARRSRWRHAAPGGSLTSPACQMGVRYVSDGTALRPEGLQHRLLVRWESGGGGQSSEALHRRGTSYDQVKATLNLCLLVHVGQLMLVASPVPPPAHCGPLSSSALSYSPKLLPTLASCPRLILLNAAEPLPTTS